MLRQAPAACLGLHCSHRCRLHLSVNARIAPAQVTRYTFPTPSADGAGQVLAYMGMLPESGMSVCTQYPDMERATDWRESSDDSSDTQSADDLIRKAELL